MTVTQRHDIHRVVSHAQRHLAHEHFDELSELLNSLTVSDVLRVLSRLKKRRRAVAYRLLEKDRALSVFERMSPSLQWELLETLQTEEVGSIFADLEPDDRVRLLDELPATVAARLLRGLSQDEQEQTAALLGYPEGAIGRHMSPQFVTTREEFTVTDTVDRLRRRLASAETVYYIPVTDSERRVLGAVTLRQLIGVGPDTQMAELVHETHIAHVAEDAEQVARRMTKLGASDISIVDDEHRLVGIFTLDDAVRILEHEESVDAARHGGAEPLRRPYLSTPIRRVVRSRIVWLLVLAAGATLTVQVLSIFEDTLAQVTILALFVPLIIGTGGNTGNQAATTVTRALALHDVTPRDVFHVLARELRVGLFLGLLLGVLGFVVSSLVYSVEVGFVIGFTLTAVCCVAASVGGVMPLIARAVKVDPAVFSNPFISTFVDATGLVIYFLIARAILQL